MEAALKQMAYVTMDGKWTEGVCPKCKQPAGAHGWLFTEPPPRKPQEDTRKAVGEVFEHVDGRDCIVSFAPRHEHKYSIVPITKNGVHGFECECGAIQPSGLSPL